MWAEVGRGKSQFKIWDLLADGRCSLAVIDFFSTRMWEGWSRLRKTRGARCRNGSAGSEGRGEESGGGAEELGAGGEEPPLFLPTPSFYGVRRRGVGDSVSSVFLPLCFSFVIPLGRFCFLGTAWAEYGGL